MVTIMRGTPMLAESVAESYFPTLLQSEAWVMEQKLDGHRVMIHLRDGLTPLVTTRNGNRYTRGLPPGLLEGMPQGEWLLDGELVGKTYYVFDILEANGLVRPESSLEHRRSVLEAFMSLVTTPHIRITYQAKTPEEKQALYVKCKVENAEGVMLKHKDSAYRPGLRSSEILKHKFTETADVVVLDVRDDGKDSVRLGAYDATGNLVDVGRSSLIGKEKRGEIQKGDVLEVKYLYLGANGRLYQPTILHKRDDKLPQECTTAQFKHVNKAVLEP